MEWTNNVIRVGQAGSIRGMLLVSLQCKPTHMCEGLKAQGINFGACNLKGAEC